MKCEKNQNSQGDQKLKNTVWLSLRLFYVLGVFEGGGTGCAVLESLMAPLHNWILPG